MIYDFWKRTPVQFEDGVLTILGDIDKELMDLESDVMIGTTILKKDVIEIKVKPGILLPRNIYRLITNFKNLKHLDLTGADFKNVETIDTMVIDTPSLKTISLGDVIAPRLKEITLMIYKTRNLKLLTIGCINAPALNKIIKPLYDTPNFHNIQCQYINAPKLVELDLSIETSNPITLNLNKIKSRCLKQVVIENKHIIPKEPHCIDMSYLNSINTLSINMENAIINFPIVNKLKQLTISNTDLLTNVNINHISQLTFQIIKNNQHFDLTKLDSITIDNIEFQKQSLMISTPTIEILCDNQLYVLIESLLLNANVETLSLTAQNITAPDKDQRIESILLALFKKYHNNLMTRSLIFIYAQSLNNNSTFRKIKTLDVLYKI